MDFEFKLFISVKCDRNHYVRLRNCTLRLKVLGISEIRYALPKLQREIASRKRDICLFATYHIPPDRFHHPTV